MRLSNKRLRDGLRDAAAPGEMRDREAFWAEFKARSRLVPRHCAETGSGFEAAGWRGWTVGGGIAAALLAVTVSLWQLIPRGDDVEQVELSTVEEISVFAECSSVLVFEDDENEGTLVWLAGLQQAGPVPGDSGNEIL